VTHVHVEELLRGPLLPVTHTVNSANPLQGSDIPAYTLCDDTRTVQPGVQ